VNQKAGFAAASIQPQLGDVPRIGLQLMAEDIERWNPLVQTLGFAIGQMTAAQASPKATGPGRSIGEWITCDSRIPAKSF
jgi:hypothetical protein